MLVWEGSIFMCLQACLIYKRYVLQRMRKKSWRLCVKVFLMVELRRGVWGLLGGEYRVLGTFLLDSQPLDEFLFFFWSMRSSSILFMSCLFWGNLAYVQGGYVQFFARMCEKLQPLVGFDSSPKTKYKDEVMMSYYL